MEGEIILEGITVHNNTICIRYPKQEDVGAMWEYVNALSQEKTFVYLQGEQIQHKDQVRYLSNLIKKIEEKKAVALVAFCNNFLIGMAEIRTRMNNEEHLGDLILSISKRYRGKGMGTTLLHLIISEAKKRIPKLQKITLFVYANNVTARGIYEKFGFVEYGRLPDGAVQKGTFVDVVFMYKNIRVGSKKIRNKLKIDLQNLTALVYYSC